jgi:hypothetical protein
MSSGVQLDPAGKLEVLEDYGKLVEIDEGILISRCGLLSLFIYCKYV